jgi:two-component system LytT family response regulator
MSERLLVYVVDDEPLALKGMLRLLRASGRTEIAGATSEPTVAFEFLSTHPVDAVFLDIQMPGMTGFELLSRLPTDPMVVFTTAFDQYALAAFDVHSVDYLLKPIDPRHLERALAKLDRVRGSAGARAEHGQLLALARELARPFPTRIASRSGDRVTFVDLDTVSHFYAKEGLTFAATGSRDVVVDAPIADLERRLDPADFLRIHRGTLVNLRFVAEAHAGFAGGMAVRLKDAKRTSLQVARDRVRAAKERLGF